MPLRFTTLLLTTLLFCAPLCAQDPQQLLSAVNDWAKMEPAFRYAFTDLNGDGRADAVVLVTGARWCGSGGCWMVVFRGTDTGFAFVSESSVTNEPIRVSPEQSSGWKNLIVYAKYGVGDVVMRFDGKGYPGNPSLQPKATTAQTNAAKTIMEPGSISLYTSAVRYDSFSEPNWVRLQDGQSLHLSFQGIGGLRKSDVEKWGNGKQLVIIYNSEEGPALLDPESLKRGPILDGLRDHPIDVIADRCLESEARTTSDMVGCYAKGLAMWDRELNRFYGRLMATLNAGQKQSIQTAQREWLQYRDAENAAFDSVINDGTLSRVSRAREAMRITAEQAQRLARLLGGTF